MYDNMGIDGRRCHPNMSRSESDAEDDLGPYGRHPVRPLRCFAHSSARHLELMMIHISITNDGNSILREIDVAHPAAKNMIELSRTQDEECGDGTTSVIILGTLFSPLYISTI
jgi:hypothetical protein